MCYNSCFGPRMGILYRWLSVRLKYFQCVGNWDNAVLLYAINMIYPLKRRRTLFERKSMFYSSRRYNILKLTHRSWYFTLFYLLLSRWIRKGLYRESSYRRCNPRTSLRPFIIDFNQTARVLLLTALINHCNLPLQRSMLLQRNSNLIKHLKHNT